MSRDDCKICIRWICWKRFRNMKENAKDIGALWLHNAWSWKMMDLLNIKCLRMFRVQAKSRHWVSPTCKLVSKFLFSPTHRYHVISGDTYDSWNHQETEVSLTCEITDLGICTCYYCVRLLPICRIHTKVESWSSPYGMPKCVLWIEYSKDGS